MVKRVKDSANQSGVVEDRLVALVMTLGLIMIVDIFIGALVALLTDIQLVIFVQYSLPVVLIVAYLITKHFTLPLFIKHQSRES